MKKLYVLWCIILLCIKSYSQQYEYETEYTWVLIRFDSTYQYLQTDTSTQNIWQIGTPNKAYFDSAYSKERGIITDSINFYPINNYSYFDLLIGDFNYEYYYPYDIFIEFKHKFDTDSLFDGGYLSISYDNGKTWINIIEDPNSWCSKPQLENVNLYSESDILFNGEKGFSGNSNGWISTWFTWHQCLVKSANYDVGDTMILRFNFISDEINTNKEGWLIDDIRLYSVDLGGAVNEIDNNELIIIYPNPVNSKLIIDFRTYFDVINIELIDMSGKSMYNHQYYSRNSISIDTNGLLKGFYLIRVLLNNNKLITRKILLE
jgi:hypothetical protein